MMMMWCLVAAFVVAPCLGFLSQDALRADVSSRLTTAQLKSHDIGDLLATVHAATLLGVSMPNGVCAALKKRDERTIVLARTAALAGCEPLPAIKNPDNVEEVYHSAMVALRSEAFPGLVAKLKGATSDRDTALLLDAAASVATKHPEVVKTADFKTFVTSLERAVTTIFRSGSFHVDGKASTAVVLSHLGSAAFTMASGGHFKIASEFAHHLAQTIVHVGTSTASPGDQAAVIRLSQILAKNSALVPVVFDVVQAKDGVLKVKFGNVFGESTQVSSASVASCKSASGASLTSGVLAMKPLGSGSFEAVLDTKKASPGVYVPEIRISSPSLGDVSLPSKPEAVIAVFGDAKVGPVSVWTSSGKSESDHITVSFPKMAGEELQIDSSSRFFHAKFKLEGSVDQPAYVGLALKNQDTGLSTVFVPKFKSGEYSLKLKYTHPVFAQAVPGNGKYFLRLVVSDPTLESVLDWKICNVNIDLERVPGAIRLAQALSHRVLPEQQFTFRSEIPAPHRVFSAIFMILAAGPLLALVRWWVYIGVNVDLNGNYLAIAFHAVLMAAMLSLGSYWWGATVFQPLRSQVVLGTIAVVVGNRLLRQCRVCEEDDESATEKLKRD
ncbi:Dolichyl-diphosphooligosaccharide--protein glycosyltransferase subunit 2 [Plasmodiophora brassicae]